MVLIDHLDDFGMFGRGSSDPTGTFSLWNVNITTRSPAVLKRGVVLWALACFDTICHCLLGPQTKAPENASLHLTITLIQLENRFEYQIITLLWHSKKNCVLIKKQVTFFNLYQIFEFEFVCLIVFIWRPDVMLKTLNSAETKESSVTQFAFDCSSTVTPMLVITTRVIIIKIIIITNIMVCQVIVVLSQLLHHIVFLDLGS